MKPRTDLTSPTNFIAQHNKCDGKMVSFGSLRVAVPFPFKVNWRRGNLRFTLAGERAYTYRIELRHLIIYSLARGRGRMMKDFYSLQVSSITKFFLRRGTISFPAVSFSRERISKGDRVFFFTQLLSCETRPLRLPRSHIARLQPPTTIKY